MSALPSVLSDTPPKKRRRPNPVVHKSTRKAPSVQTAITARRMHGQSKSQIARELGVGRNTVTSILELNDVEQQIAEARQSAIALAPLAVTAIQTDLSIPGNGALGLRLLNDIGAIGEDAIDTIKRHNAKQSSAINVLVQAGANVTLNSNDNGTGTVQNSNNVTDRPVAPTGKQPKDGVGR